MPELIVFDLDLTLWNCGRKLWCDQLRTPLHHVGPGHVRSACRSDVRLYPDVRGMLDRLTAAGQLLAVASRTNAPDTARELMDLLGIADHFSHREIHPGDKATHFRALRQHTGLAFDDMLFFDDEPRNIDSVSALGVDCRLVHHGMTDSVLEGALPGSRLPLDREPGRRHVWEDGTKHTRCESTHPTPVNSAGGHSPGTVAGPAFREHR